MILIPAKPRDTLAQCIEKRGRGEENEEYLEPPRHRRSGRLPCSGQRPSAADVGYPGVVQVLLYECAKLKVVMQIVGIGGRGEPVGLPGPNGSKPKSHGMYFLTHRLALFLLFCG